MRSRTRAHAAALLLVSTLCHADDAPTRPGAGPTLRPITLAQVLERVESGNPTLENRRAELSAAEGAQADAAALFDANPELSTSATQRRVQEIDRATDRRREWSIGLAQPIEIAGQRGFRRQAAASAMSALRADIFDTRAQVRAEASSRFFRVLALQRLVELETRSQRLFDQTATAVAKRRAAGEDTRLDANLANVEAERARNQLAIAGERLLEARTELAETLQLPPADLPEASGDLSVVTLPYRLSELQAAVEEQPRLRALLEREHGAAARLRLEQARRYPDVTVGLGVAREGPAGGRERLTTVSLSVPLPLFKRNPLGIGQAATQLDQVRIERQAAARDLRARVGSLWIKVDSLAVRVRRLQESVLPALDDNQSLSAKSRAAGQIGLVELIVVDRQAIDARRDLIDALTGYHDARIALELAAGRPERGAPR